MRSALPLAHGERRSGVAVFSQLKRCEARARPRFFAHLFARGRTLEEAQRLFHALDGHLTHGRRRGRFTLELGQQPIDARRRVDHAAHLFLADPAGQIDARVPHGRVGGQRTTSLRACRRTRRSAHPSAGAAAHRPRSACQRRSAASSCADAPMGPLRLKHIGLALRDERDRHTPARRRMPGRSSSSRKSVLTTDQAPSQRSRRRPSSRRSFLKSWEVRSVRATTS